MTRNDEMLGDGYEIVPYRDLPREHRLAMAWYMAVDGEAWAEVFDDLPEDAECPDIGEDRAGWAAFWLAGLEARLPRIDDLYGDVPFGMASVPMERILAAIDRDPDMASAPGPSFRDAVLAQRGGDAHGTEARWPVILSSTDDETLQDGWHRIGSYVRSGCADVPCLFYPAERHLVPAPGPTAP